WVTNELAVSTFEYGTTMSYGFSASISAGAAIGGTVALTGLAPATTYYYCIHSTDTSGNASSACGQSFTTAAAPDTTAPTLSVIVVTSLATSTATITWTTSEAASAQVAYGTTASYGSSSSLDSSLALTHSATLTGLAPNTIYHYQVRSTDAAGNFSTSTDATFTTQSVQVLIPPDTTPPVMSSISTASVSNIAATITWTTNELATSTLVYGTTMSYGSEATIPANALLAHEAALINLTPQTTYYYCISATDLAGNTSNSCGNSFTTGSTPDTTPPVISNISEASVSPYDATIAWSTNELATSSIRYGTAANNLALTLLVTVSSALVHEATILSLASGTTYYYCIDATDLAANTASSCGHSFTTGIASSTPPPDTTPPTISLVTVAPIATSTASITWTTSEVANGQVEYGTSTAYGSSAGLDTDFALTDEANLTGLTPNTTYHYRIRSSDEVGNIAYSNDNSFTTGALPTITPETTPPVISGIATTSVSSVVATIVWTTNELAVSTMSYGTSQSYGSIAALPATALLAHSATLTNLSPNTTYYYCIHATDVWGNAVSSCGNTFMTGAAPLPPDTTPPVISGVAQESVASYDATIVWSTNELATSSIRYGTSTSYGSVLAIDASAGLVHSGTIADLSSATTYDYCIDATDLAGNTANSCGHSFTTAAAPLAPDTTPPTILLVTAASLATSTATVTWTTNELANAQIEYGTSTSYGFTSPLNTSFALTHSESLSNLLPDTTYHYRVISADEAGNLATLTDETFMTSALPIPQEIINPAPSSTPISTPSVSSTVTFSTIETQSVGTSTVTITWNTDLPASGQVEYGTSEQLGSATPLNTTLSTSHSVTITNLAPDTNYIFRVSSAPVGGGSATLSTNYEFNTLGVPMFTTTPTNVSAVTAIGVATSTAMITWTTDQSATAEVQYGISTEYGESTSGSFGTLSVSQNIALTQLAPATTYHYRVKSVNSAGDITFSDDHMFTTVALSVLSIPSSTPIVFGPGPALVPVQTPATISNLSITAHDQTSATLTWNVNTNNADAAAEYDVRYSTSPITENDFANATQDQATAILYPDLAPNGAARTYVVADLDPNITYYFAITSKYETSAWAPISNVTSVVTTGSSGEPVIVENNSGGARQSAAVSVSPGGGGGGSAVTGPIGSPTLTSAAGDDSQITLNWNNPNTTSFVRTIVIRKEGGYPTSPTDGQVIYEGNGGTFTDTSVLNGTMYYYAIYSYDRAKNYSSGINVSIAPQAGVGQTQLNENPTITTGVQYHFTQVFAQGVTDVEVAHLQEMLARYNVYPENRVTSYFGPLTEVALKRFQSLHGIPQTGVTDAQTQILLNAASLSDQTMNVPQDLAVFNTDLQLGMTSEDVNELQQFLIYEGDYPEAQVTGYFGTLTQDAVIDFQTKYGILPAVGYVGPITRHTIATLSGF
ncbi:MAG TPA: fibronectin type III domain-containing protein, partial [Candidatus Paceibacterota bacterium]|nr:fibronectin type III domain-containing protein [Candidatus Paceibacterota bacterium]